MYVGWCASIPLSTFILLGSLLFGPVQYNNPSINDTPVIGFVKEKPKSYTPAKSPLDNTVYISIKLAS